MITAIIPARSGSKRLAEKNIKLLAGRPLVFHTLDAVLGHELILEVVFTTDSTKYAELVEKEYGSRVRSIMRPGEYASDKAKVYDEVRRLCDTGEVKTEWYILCLPTCPLRDHQIVADVLSEWDKVRQPMFTGMEYDFPVQFSFTLEEGANWRAVFEDSPMITGNTRSQDIQKTYRPNGAIYLQHKKNLHNPTLYVNALFYPMSVHKSLDVDTDIEFSICEQLIHRRSNND